jgi:glycosyltransferase involved in cell wall biosynthesis
MKKTLCISTHLYPTTGYGGPSISFNNFLDFLEKNNHMYTAVSATNLNSYNNGNKEYLKIFFKSKFFLKYGFSIRLFLFILVNASKYENFIINGITNFPLFIGILMGSILRKKVFIFTRGGLESSRVNDWNLLKKYYYFLNIKLLKKLNISKKLYLVFQSEDEKNRSCLKSHHYLICSNYSEDNFKNINKEFENLHILYVGRFSPEKGSDRLLNLLDFFLEFSTNKHKISLAVASNEEIPEINNYSNKSNISIEYNLNKNDLDSLYSRANIIFFPSFKENFGNALVEGVINGLAPVLYEDTHWAALFKKNAALSENQLREALSSSKVNSELFRMISKSARKAVINDFIKGNDFNKVLVNLS